MMIQNRRTKDDIDNISELENKYNDDPALRKEQTNERNQKSTRRTEQGKRSSRAEKKLTAVTKPTTFTDKGQLDILEAVAKHTENSKVAQEKEEKEQTTKETNKAVYIPPIHCGWRKT